jgi:hypothetical protein
LVAVADHAGCAQYGAQDAVHVLYAVGSGQLFADGVCGAFIPGKRGRDSRLHGPLGFAGLRIGQPGGNLGLGGFQPRNLMQQRCCQLIVDAVQRAVQPSLQRLGPSLSLALLAPQTG